MNYMRYCVMLLVLCLCTIYPMNNPMNDDSEFVIHRRHVDQAKLRQDVEARRKKQAEDRRERLAPRLNSSGIYKSPSMENLAGLATQEKTKSKE